MTPDEAVVIINHCLKNEYKEWSVFLRTTIKKYLTGVPQHRIQFALEIMSNEQVGWWLNRLILDQRIVYDEEELVLFEKGQRRMAYDI